MTKYGDMIEDDHWEQDNSEPTEQPDRTTVKRHEIDVIYVTDSDEDMGYGREKYTAHLNYDGDFGGVHVTFVVEHRWKGNYWRDVTDWEFRDIPEPVRQRVAAVLPVDRPADLDTDVRAIDEGGESRFNKYHKPALDAHSGGEDMWAESYLREAGERLDGAAETLSDGEHVDAVESMVSDLQELVAEIRGTPQEGCAE